MLLRLMDYAKLPAGSDFVGHKHVIDGSVVLGASGLPIADDPMPALYHYHDSDSDLDTNPSIIQGPIGEAPAFRVEPSSTAKFESSSLHDTFTWSADKKPRPAAARRQSTEGYQEGQNTNGGRKHDYDIEATGTELDSPCVIPGRRSPIQSEAGLSKFLFAPSAATQETTPEIPVTTAAELDYSDDEDDDEDSGDVPGRVIDDENEADKIVNELLGKYTTLFEGGGRHMGYYPADMR
ncbi:MAG: hypothetical protein Q9168_005792 [Polycauliona sp. 1 TL-2023]